MEQDARRKQLIQAAGAICIKKKNKKMNKDLLFAVDTNTNEVIVSESPKGTNKVNFIERIGYNDNEILYNAVVTLTSITKASKKLHIAPSSISMQIKSLEYDLNKQLFDRKSNRLTLNDYVREYYDIAKNTLNKVNVAYNEKIEIKYTDKQLFLPKTIKK